MKRLTIAILFIVGAAICACGGTEAVEKSRRQSVRYYEAAYIAWFEQGDNLAAIRNLTRAVEADPDNHYAHYLLGTIRLGRGEYDLAEKHLRRSLELRQNGNRPELTEVQNSFGVLLLITGRAAEAVVHLEPAAFEVLNREPWLALGNLGWAYTELGEYDKAIEVLRRALFDQPRFCVGMFRLGVAHYMKKDYAASEKMLSQSLSISESGCDQMQESYYFLGMIYLRRGDVASSQQMFERCVFISAVTETGARCAAATGD